MYLDLRATSYVTRKSYEDYAYVNVYDLRYVNETVAMWVYLDLRATSYVTRKSYEDYAYVNVYDLRYVNETVAMLFQKACSLRFLSLFASLSFYIENLFGFSYISFINSLLVDIHLFKQTRLSKCLLRTKSDRLTIFDISTE